MKMLIGVLLVTAGFAATPEPTLTDAQQIKLLQLKLRYAQDYGKLALASDHANTTWAELQKYRKELATGHPGLMLDLDAESGLDKFVPVPEPMVPAKTPEIGPSSVRPIPPLK